MPADDAPSFFLYGEPPRAAATGFLHLEPLAVRSRPSDWSIPLHRHPDLNHVFLITHGGGRIGTATRPVAFSAPCLLFIPAEAAHGFDFKRESTGQVLTLASSFLTARPACADVRATLFETAEALACDGALTALQDAFSSLAQELSWTAPGHGAAVEAAVLQVLVLSLRQRAASQGAAGRDQRLLARFREAVEQRFREHLSLEDYAGFIGVSLSRLHQACRRAADCTPLGLVQARLQLEAERSLLYSDMSVTDIALNLGFEDPAYFSRFFAKRLGISPSSFRKRRT